MLFTHAPGGHSPHILYVRSLNGLMQLSAKFLGEPKQHFLVDQKKRSDPSGSMYLPLPINLTKVSIPISESRRQKSTHLVSGRATWISAGTIPKSAESFL